MKKIIRIIVVAILVLLIGAIALTIYLNTHGHPDVRVADFVPNAVKATVQPWNVRAQAMIPKMFEGENRQTIAKSIQGIAHPTGKNPQFGSLDVRPSGDGISARFEIAWQGGLSANDYKTVVIWECTQQNHLRAEVTADSAPIAADKANLKKLDDYFRTEIYPALCKDLQ
jgi:hypothetical protein